MKFKSAAAFTKLDMMIVVGTLVMLAVLLVYLRPRAVRPRAARINCVSQLKQVGLGFTMWANDHGDRFPWAVPMAEGGTKEFAHLSNATLHYAVASNELISPKILTCTGDKKRIRTHSWTAPLHKSLSYFASLSTIEPHTVALLAGDRHVSTNSSTMAGLLTVEDTKPLRWTKELHEGRGEGNVCFADGSVRQLSTSDLRKSFDAALEAFTNQPVRLVIP
jgi:prepilin-type processing-associated H-X9-DG protein